MVEIDITLFRPIVVFGGTDSIMLNIPHIQLECGNILHNTVNPTKQCYSLNNVMENETQGGEGNIPSFNVLLFLYILSFMC